MVLKTEPSELTWNLVQFYIISAQSKEKYIDGKYIIFDFF